MRQVVIPRFGAPDVLEVRECPDPSPGSGDIRIRIRAAGINNLKKVEFIELQI
jgi:NADPH2:quinone reductase